MPTPTIPMTLLECINMLLQGIRAAPLGSLDQADANEDSAQALQTINEVNREFQMEGWFFNTLTDKLIDPDVDDTVTLPANTLKVLKSRYASSPYPLTQKGLKVFDPRDGGTLEIGETVQVDLVECWEFDDLSAAAKMYVTAVAARKFCIPKLPERSVFSWTEEYVQKARSLVELEDGQQRDQTLPETSPHFYNHRRGKRTRG